MKKSKLHQCEASGPPLNLKQHYSKFSIDQVNILKVTSQQLSKRKQQNFQLAEQVQALTFEINKLATQNKVLDTQNAYLKQALAQQHGLIRSKVFLDTTCIDSKLSQLHQDMHEKLASELFDTNSNFNKDRKCIKLLVQQVQQPHGQDNDDLDICQYGQQSVLIGLQETYKTTNSLILSSQTRIKTIQNQPSCSILQKRKNRSRKMLNNQIINEVYPKQNRQQSTNQNDITKYLLDNNSMLYKQVKQLKRQLSIMNEENQNLIQLMNKKRTQFFEISEKIQELKNLCILLKSEKGITNNEEKIAFFQSIFRRVNSLLCSLSIAS